jgi:oxidoreductase
VTNALVTGASGFLGGRLAQVLIERGENVRILARRSSNLSHLDGFPVEIIHGSIDDEDSIRRAVAGCQIIYHCAWAATDWASWDIYDKANVVGVRNMVKAAAQVKSLERFVHVSTSDVYGFPVIACDETHPLTDIGVPYNRSKVMGERIVWDACNRGLPVTVVRPVDIYGPRSMNFVFEIAQLISQRLMIVTDGGRCHAGLVYIDNAVDCIIQAAQAPQALGQAYNVRDETDETWRQYVDALADALGKPRPWLSLPSGVAFLLAKLFETTYRTLHLRGKPLFTRHAVLVLARDQGYSIAKAQRELGFKSKVTFEDGVRRSAEWFLAMTRK